MAFSETSDYERFDGSTQQNFFQTTLLEKGEASDWDR